MVGYVIQLSPTKTYIEIIIPQSIWVREYKQLPRQNEKRKRKKYFIKYKSNNKIKTKTKEEQALSQWAIFAKKTEASSRTIVVGV